MARLLLLLLLLVGAAAAATLEEYGRKDVVNAWVLLEAEAAVA